MALVKKLASPAKGNTVQLTGRPANNIVAFAGDSRIANAMVIVGANYNETTRSIGGWTRGLTKQSFRSLPSNIHGVGGYKSDEVLALLRATIAQETAGTIVVLCSTNDRAASPTPYTAKKTIDNLKAIEDLVVTKYNKILIWLNEMPRGGSNVLTGANLQAHLSVVAWLRNRAGTPGIYVANTFDAMADLTQSDARPLTGMMGADGLHPSAIGAYTAALELKKIIDVLFPAQSSLPSGVADVYDATNNPRGVMNANPYVTGTTGTVNTPAAGTMTGSLATGWAATLTNGTGITVTLSKVTSGGKDWQQIAISGKNASQFPSLSILASSAITSLIDLGDTLEQVLEWEIDAGQTGVMDIMAIASLSGLTRRELAGDATLAQPLPNTALAMVYKLGPFVAGAAEDGFFKPGVVVDLLQNVDVALTLRFRLCAARKIV